MHCAREPLSWNLSVLSQVRRILPRSAFLVLIPKTQNLPLTLGPASSSMVTCMCILYTYTLTNTYTCTYLSICMHDLLRKLCTTTEHAEDPKQPACMVNEAPVKQMQEGPKKAMSAGVCDHRRRLHPSETVGTPDGCWCWEVRQGFFKSSPPTKSLLADLFSSAKQTWNLKRAHL